MNNNNEEIIMNARNNMNSINKINKKKGNNSSNGNNKTKKNYTNNNRNKKLTNMRNQQTNTNNLMMNKPETMMNMNTPDPMMNNPEPMINQQTNTNNLMMNKPEPMVNNEDMNNNNNNITKVESLTNNENNNKKNKNKNMNMNMNNTKQIKKELNEICMNLLNHQIVMKLFHFQTTTYGAHKASDAYLEKFSGLMDQFLEVAQGIYGKVSLSRYAVSGNTHKNETINTHLNGMISYLKTKINTILSNYTELINLRDELLSDLEQLKYLLTFQ